MVGKSKGKDSQMIVYIVIIMIFCALFDVNLSDWYILIHNVIFPLVPHAMEADSPRLRARTARRPAASTRGPDKNSNEVPTTKWSKSNVLNFGWGPIVVTTAKHGDLQRDDSFKLKVVSCSHSDSFDRMVR